MRRFSTRLLTAVLIYGTSALATYPGSVVSSFYAAPLTYGSLTVFPQGITYGGGYLWIMYFDGVLTKRRFPDGSLISTVACPEPAWGGEIAWDARREYVVIRTVFTGICIVDSKTGSIINSLPNPPGAGALWGIEYNDYYAGRPIWVGDYKRVFNLDANGSVVNSFDLSTWPHAPRAYAFDDDTAGGPFIYVGAVRAGYSARIYTVEPSTFSILNSFVSPSPPNGLVDITWDGRYLWQLEMREGVPGWVKRFVAHSSPAVEPASLGKIKALYR